MPQVSSKPKDAPAARLLAWYDMNRRALAWRALPGEAADPYGVWLSEIMLQQTTVAAVDKYFRSFVARWPDVHALAAASLDDVRAAWAGLGYYSRAANLHRTAALVARDFAGRFPREAVALRQLPGIGDYTAGAIAAIAFDAPEAAVDANAERVIARFFAVESPLPKSKPELRRLAQTLVPEKRAGDFAQGLMDLGALVCTPKRPACPQCPWNNACRAFANGTAELLPRRAGQRTRPLKRGAAFVARDRKGAVLLVRRPERGLLGGMLQPPLGPWSDGFPVTEDALRQAPFRADWKRRPGFVRHGFTHFELEIEVWRAELDDRSGFDGIWVASHQLHRVALPTVMGKIIDHAFPSFASPAER
ncbi:MAG TPA: A/G-specific adenine glycosylase [Rhizomicrobium sp.]|jgi:A/G-specific adenine glycosylase|nr:A/G-specific adenine glycosylase [Rhizomicrobium sp.]